MNLEDILACVAEPYRQAFVSFIETGEGSPQFLDYLDADPDCQAAVEHAIELQAAGLRGFATGLRDDWKRMEETTPRVPDVHALEARLVDDLRELVEVEPARREEIVTSAVRRLEAAVQPAARLAAASVLRNFGVQIERDTQGGRGLAR